jgi:hypothetical protein
MVSVAESDLQCIEGEKAAGQAQILSRNTVFVENGFPK